MIRRRIIILMGTLLFLLTGCTIDWKKSAQFAAGKAKEMYEKYEEKNQTDSDKTTEEDIYIVISEEEVKQEAERVVNIILDALKEKDAKPIKDSFSIYERKENTDIDKQIENALNFIDGNIVSIGEVSGSYGGGSTSAERGDIKTLYNGTIYDIVTDKGISYTLIIHGIYNFHNNEEKEGLYSVCIFDDVESNKISNYGTDIGMCYIGQ